MNDGTSDRQLTTRRGRIGVALGLAIYGAFLVAILPVTPFEWDEVLFLRAVEGYDVAAHAPHPPGYPVFVACAWFVTRIVGSPVLGCQLASVFGALTALAATGLLALRLGAGRASAWLAVFLLSTLPAFVFYAPVGLSDVLATGLATLAGWRLVVAADSDASAWEVSLAAGIGALAVAVRPQVVTVLVPAALWVHLRLVRISGWGEIARGWVTAVVVSICCWSPAVFLTGPARFLEAVHRQAASFSTSVSPRDLWHAELEWVLSRWLESPFGAGWLVALWWLSVVVGAISWWRSGRRALVVLAASSAGLYLLVSSSVMDCMIASRYILPAIPWLAVLAAGTTRVPTKWLKPVGAGMIVALCGGWIMWWVPVVSRRSVEPAPVWAALEEADRLAPSGAAIVYDDGLEPHATWLFDPDERVIVRHRRWKRMKKDGVDQVFEVRIKGFDRPGRVVFASSWDDDRWQRMTRNRYLESRVVVTRP